MTITINTSALTAADKRQPINRPDPVFEKLSGFGNSSQQTLIGMFDTGFSITTPAVADNIWTNAVDAFNGADDDRNGKTDDVNGWDFIENDGRVAAHQPTSPMGEHGTGTLSLATANSARIRAVLARGIGPQPTSPQTVVSALAYLIEKGARVVNISAGWYDPSYTRAVRKLMVAHPEVVFVMSAGNDFQEVGTRGRRNLEPDQFVAAQVLPNLVVVASSIGGEREIESNYSKRFVTVAAEVNVDAAETEGTYRRRESTSFATPMVTNVIAKCLCLDPTLSPAQIKKLLILSSVAKPVWRDLVEAGGVVAAPTALRLAFLNREKRKGAAALTAAARQLGVGLAEQTRLLGLVAAL